MFSSLKRQIRAWITPGAFGLDEFNEEWYLLNYPDVASQVNAGLLRSGRQHYIIHGWAEGRMGRPTREVSPKVDYHLECKITAAGAFFIAGWVDDAADPIDTLVMESDGTRLHLAADELYRHGRDGTDVTLATPKGEHGFWLFRSYARLAVATDYNVSIRSVRRLLAKVCLRPTLVTDIEMRDFVLGFFNTRWVSGNLPHLDVLELNKGFGKEIIALNRRILDDNNRWLVSRYGATPRPITKSLITCLYGLPDFLALQVALFSDSQRFKDVEFIYVNNSPEYKERLDREAEQASHLYDVPIAVIHPEANIGFAAANNLAARHASSDRLLFINPDVFPKDREWLLKHDNFAATDTGKFFGGCLYYNDGSVMHAGMYFVRETFKSHRMGSVELLDTWHFGKGAADWGVEAKSSRAVPAVTGAFMSIDRAHFEKLGGFNEDHIFGHYEDGDLCLKSSAAGQPVWYCADVRLWHMEGKGSKKSGHHDGARRVNRWQLTNNWSSSNVTGV